MNVRLIILFAATVLIAVTAPAANIPAPPGVVKQYLAEQQAWVVSGQMMVIDEAAYQQARPAAVDQLMKDAQIDVATVRPGLYRTGTAADLTKIRQAAVQTAATLAPALATRGNLLRTYPLSTVVFQLTSTATLTDVSTALTDHPLDTPEPLSAGRFKARVLITDDPWASLAVAAQLQQLPAIDWAVPDCLREARKSYLINDITNLWHLVNTNTLTTNSTAMATAWNTTLGDPNVVIAIIDDGLEITHPDIVSNLWLNTAEVPGDGIDNDANGYTDDINGWDFFASTNDVNPNDPNENHGTATAGLAASRGDNALGVSGGCPECSLLPIKVFDGNAFVTDLQLAAAVNYAARYAHIISLSLTTGSAIDQQLRDAFNKASTGSVIFASTGNDADYGYYPDCTSPGYFGWMRHTHFFSTGGAHTYRWSYEKDFSISFPQDTAWLDSVRLPGGVRYNFEDGMLPAGWTLGGDADWFASPETNDPMVIGQYSLRAGDINDNQTSWVEVAFSGSGQLSFYYQVFGEANCDGGTLFVYDGLAFYVDGAYDTIDANIDPLVQGITNIWAVGTPAALTSVVAVGSSTIAGYHAAYSQHGTNMGVVAPSGGSTDREPGVWTTDRLGTNGYSTTDYEPAFSGTSAASPLAAGIAGLILSANPSLSPAELRAVIEQSARKIGTVSYTNGFNTRYGYGQIDGRAAMQLMLSNSAPAFITQSLNSTQAVVSINGIQTNRPFTVYQADSLAGPNWTVVPPAPRSGKPVWGQEVLTLPVTNSASIFRIQKH